MSDGFPHLSLVLGGAASGKSAVAEQLTVSAQLPKTYIATAQAYDDEMETKIQNHQTSRGTGWHTIEEPLDIQRALTAADPRGVVLIDCLTLWLSNHMMQDAHLDDLAPNLLTAITASNAPVICVSNEAGLGVVPDNALARKFRQAQGELNQQIAHQADLVINVTAGLPQVLKGQLPTTFS